MKPRYSLRPKADQDLDEHSRYLAQQGSPDAGHRFLVAAHESFALLATQPEMGWHFRSRYPGTLGLRAFRVSGFERMLILYLPHPTGVEILRIVHGARDLPRILQHDTL
ncbi:MAG: type II toxin-antitoxin system RelE/ParE family toxin [Terriglobales bacterium]